MGKKNNQSTGTGNNLKYTEHFTLKKGKYVTDPRLSNILFTIQREQPEKAGRIPGSPYTWDDTGMAELFAVCYNNIVRYCSEKKEWFSYKDGAWREDYGGCITAGYIQEFYQLLLLYCLTIEDTELQSNFVKFVGRIGDGRFRYRLQKDAMAKGDLLIQVKDFDANPNLINTLNGTFNLKDNTFREPDPKDFITMQTNFAYSLKRPKYERWETFIDEVTEGDKEKANYLQKALGYSLFGVSKEECMFILHGKTTRNGKSTLLDAIHHLLGNYAAVVPVAIICEGDRKRDGEAPSPVLASLKGKRFVTTSESNQYGKLDEERIKQLTGGEEITARHLHEKPITFLPQFKLWLSCNDLPSVRDKSLFASDRLRIIEFNKHFSDAEQDKTLKSEFKSEKAMSGIFTWLIEGYKKYEQEGLKMPESLHRVVKQYERDNDLILQFLEEKCERSADARIQKSELYKSYKMWCKSNGYYFTTSQKFNKGVEAHPEWYDDNKGKTNGRERYDGLCLKSS